MADERNGNPLERMVAKYGFSDGASCMKSLRDSAFSQGDKKPLSDAELMTALIMSDQFNLNPWAGQISAFRNKWGVINIVITIDGWAQLLSGSAIVNGVEIEMDFMESDEGPRPPKLTALRCPISCKARIFRKDWERPLEITEYFHECYRDSVPWNTMPARQLRHKAIIQACRLALGVTAVDEDEARDIKAQQGIAMTANLPAPEARREIPTPSADKVAMETAQRSEKKAAVDSDLDEAF